MIEIRSPWVLDFDVELPSNTLDAVTCGCYVACASMLKVIAT
jgi:hypothetical protein